MMNEMILNLAFRVFHWKPTANVCKTCNFWPSYKKPNYLRALPPQLANQPTALVPPVRQSIPYIL